MDTVVHYVSKTILAEIKKCYGLFPNENGVAVIVSNIRQILNVETVI